ncbi:MAG: S41 family peptidase [Raoultibacter sp.]
MGQHGLQKAEAVSARNKKIIGCLTIFLCVCLAFFAGFLVRGNASLLTNLGFTSLTVASEKNPGATVTGNTYNSLSARVAEVEGVIAQDSLDSYDLNEATLQVLDAFAASTKDPYLRYFDEAHYSAYLEDTASKYAGIGVLFGEYKGQSYAVDVFTGSVADTAGVKVGDFVVAIDGVRDNWSLTETVKALSREDGSTAIVTWRRPSALEAEGGKEFTTTLACSPYAQANVTTEMSNKVGVIKVRQLTQDSDVLVRQAIVDLQSQGAQSLVLDVRDNPGGYLTQAVNIASLFVKSGVIMQIETVDGTTTKKATGDAVTALPLAVLVNRNTAAASEVLAAALQDNQRATLVGEATLGKGAVQVVHPLSFGGALRYTAAHYLSPLGHIINEVGVTPAIPAGLAADATSDTQKMAAIETAQSLIAR